MTRFFNRYSWLVASIIISAASLHYGYCISNTPQKSIQITSYDNGYVLYLNEFKDDEVNKPINDGLAAYNIVKDGADSFSPYCMVIKTTAGQIVAGLLTDICKSESRSELSHDTPSSADRRPDLCLLHNFWVDEKHSKAGLDTAMIHALINHMYAVQCPTIQWETWEFYDGLKDFFEQQGFETIATLPSPKEITGYEGYVMRKTINNHTKLCTPIFDNQKYQLIEEESWNQDHHQFVSDKVDELFVAHAQILAQDPFTLFITLPTGQIIAGGIGTIIQVKNYGTYCTLNRLWVHENYRKHGLGSDIMAAVDRYACRKKCKMIQLETYEWQAKGFYEKQGFATIATVANPDNSFGMEQYYMRKVLA
ncbi:MAG: GNAT family N-acetyltransferase [Candidatus Dependentiae bacterium]|nr:GNAT family N-acetyltransferase [Candidatus Dependentiae bacterium]